jgi:hypothetical protein
MSHRIVGIEGISMNVQDMNLHELTALFRKLGAGDPEGWARSQIDDNSSQLARFLFLKQAWKSVVGEDDREWISEARRVDPDGPGGEIGPAIARVLAAGGDQDDLTKIVRVKQWELLFSLCHLLDDPDWMREEDSEIIEKAGDVLWCLVQVDENGQPIAIVDGLHESVLETEPTGREMRPK